MASTDHAATAPAVAGTPTPGPAVPPLTLRQRRQIALITLGAIGVFSFLRWLPTGTNLSHMDFRVTATNPIDFCDPLNPQFMPVVAVASPVTMTLSAAPAVAGREVVASVTLKTASGKPIGPRDLLVVHTKLLHLLITDPSLTDYQHVHPVPGRRAGEWNFRFTPRFSGVYRIFADFTPAATARGLYANTDLTVQPAGREGQLAAGPADRRSAAGAALRRDPVAGAATLAPDRGGKTFLRETGGAPGTASSRSGIGIVEQAGYRFELRARQWPIRVRAPEDLKLTVARVAGGPVPMEPVMGAFAHLVAFDQARSGFAHLHPLQSDLTQRLDALRPTLDFKLMLPQRGRYVIWAQLNLGGDQTFVPFWFDVTD